MRESGVEAEQDGKGLTPGRGRRHGLPVKRRLLDGCGSRGDLRIPHPPPAVGMEVLGVEPIEQLTKEIGVVSAHT